MRVFLLAIAALCVAVARPHVHPHVTSDNATVILVLDVSGSMQANDVKPTRLAAAQTGDAQVFLDQRAVARCGRPRSCSRARRRWPPRRRPITSSSREAVDAAGEFRGFGGTAIGDALAAAVKARAPDHRRRRRRGQLAVVHRGAATRGLEHARVDPLPLGRAPERGLLQPLEGAARREAAGIPVYTVALGTPGATTLRASTGFPGGGGGVSGGGFGFGGRRGLAPDPVTLHAIATRPAASSSARRSAGAVDSAYSKLGSSLGRTRGRVEVTDIFLALGAALLVTAGVLGALWSPRLP